MMQVVNLAQPQLCLSVCLSVCVCVPANAYNSFSHTCAARGEIQSHSCCAVPAVARRSLSSLTTCGQGGGEEGVFSQLLLLPGGQYAIMKQLTKGRTPPASTRATSPDAAIETLAHHRDYCDILVCASVTRSQLQWRRSKALSGAGVTILDRGSGSGDKAETCLLLRTEQFWYTEHATPDRENDRSRRMSLEIPVMICRHASQPAPVWRILARSGHRIQDHSRGTRYRQCEPLTDMVTAPWGKRSPAARRVCT
jgi:hypothetical protein